MDCISAGDIDGDGDTDLYAVATSLADLYWWENDGSENFTKHTITTWEAVNVNYIVAEDYDNDGDCDLVGLATSLADLYIWERIDTGWESRATISTWEAVNIECISAVNIDHLKGPDFYGVATSLSDLFWWENKTEVLINANWHPVTVTTNAPNIDFISAADIDDDGDSDFFAYSETNGTLYTVEQLNPHFGSFQAKVTGLENVNQIAAGDPNGDGKADCWILRQQDAKLQLALNDGTGDFVLYDVKDGCASKDHHMVPVDDGVYLFKPDWQAVSWLVPDSQDPSDYTETFVFHSNIIEGTTFATLVQKSEDEFYIAASMPERREIWRFEEVIDGEDRYLIPHVITYNAPEGVTALHGADFEGSSFGSLAVAASASPMQLGVWNNDGGGTFAIEEQLSAVEIESASAVKVRSFGRSVSDLFILDPDGLTVRFLANRFVLNPPPTEPDLAYVASTLEPTYTLQEKDKAFKVKVTNIAGTGSITLNTQTKLEFGTSPKYEAYLSSETTVTTEVELVFEEETVPAGMSSGAYDVTIQFRATGYSKDYVLPEKVHIPPEVFMVGPNDPPMVVRGECDFEDVTVLSGAVMRVEGTDIRVRKVEFFGKCEQRPVGWYHEEQVSQGFFVGAEDIIVYGGIFGNCSISTYRLEVKPGAIISASGLGYSRKECEKEEALSLEMCGGISETAGGGGGGGFGENGESGSGTGAGAGGNSNDWDDLENRRGKPGGDGAGSALHGEGGGFLAITVKVGTAYGVFINSGVIGATGQDGKSSCDGGGGGGSGGAVWIDAKLDASSTGTFSVAPGKGGAHETNRGGDGGEGYFYGPVVDTACIYETAPGVYEYLDIDLNLDLLQLGLDSQEADGELTLRKESGERWDTNDYQEDGDTDIEDPVWTDENLDGYPEWPAEKNDPVCLLIGKKPKIVQGKSKLKVRPALTRTIYANIKVEATDPDGIGNSLTFGPVEVKLTGDTVELPEMVTETAISDKVTDATYHFTWKVSYYGGMPFTEFETSQHRIFVTYSSPKSNYLQLAHLDENNQHVDDTWVSMSITAIRMQRACVAAKGTTADEDKLSTKVAEYITSEIGFNGDEFEWDPFTHLDGDAPLAADCISLANLAAAALRLLGVDAKPWRAYAQNHVDANDSATWGWSPKYYPERGTKKVLGDSGNHFHAFFFIEELDFDNNTFPSTGWYVGRPPGQQKITTSEPKYLPLQVIKSYLGADAVLWWLYGDITLGRAPDAEWKLLDPQGDPIKIPGVSIEPNIDEGDWSTNVADDGVYSLQYKVGPPKKLKLGSDGPEKDVTAGGDFTLTCQAGRVKLKVTVNAGALPGADTSKPVIIAPARKLKTSP